MKTNQLLLSLLTATIGVRAASLPQHDDLLVNSSSSSSSAMVRHRETLNEAAANVRRLLRDVPYGSIATVFPPSSHVGDEIAIDGGWRKPGEPFAMLEYHAPCMDLPSLTFLLLPISLSVRNIIGSTSGAVSYMVREEPVVGRSVDGQGGRLQQRPFSAGRKDRGMMDHARVSLMGNMTLLPSSSLPTSERSRLASCYTSYHPDAAAWLPDADDSPHKSTWARFDVEGVYYVGGFGDEHYIGEIPVEKLREG